MKRGLGGWNGQWGKGWRSDGEHKVKTRKGHWGRERQLRVEQVSRQPHRDVMGKIGAYTKGSLTSLCSLSNNHPSFSTQDV